MNYWHNSFRGGGVYEKSLCVIHCTGTPELLPCNAFCLIFQCFNLHPIQHQAYGGTGKDALHKFGISNLKKNMLKLTNMH